MTAVAAHHHPRWSGIAAWALLIVFETVAQLSLRIGGEALQAIPFGRAWVLAALTNPWVLLGIAGYLCSFAAWMVILDKVSLSFGFPATALVIVVVTFASWALLGESLDALRLAGIALVIAGLVVMGSDAS